ncbi:MAG TPA: WD40 repeat domain-containing protein [Planctomycetota bacterium]|nr:WD40 repeat domain-containing protein [Planctomycetota bacterium]
MIGSVLMLALLAAQGDAAWPVKSKFQMPEEHGGLWSLAISPDSKVVAGGTGIVTYTVGAKKSVAGGDVLLWDPAGGKVRKILGKHGTSPGWLCFSRDGKALGSFSKDDGEFKLWDLATGKPLQSLKLGTSVDGNAASIAFDGRTLVTVERKSIPAGKDEMSYLFAGTLTARDAKTGKTLWSLNDSGVIVMGLSPDGKTLAAFIQKQVMEGDKPKITDRAVKLLDASTGKELRALERGDLGYADAIGFHQDGKSVYAFHHGEIFRWDAQDGKPQPTVSLESWRNSSTLAFSADGRVLAIVDFMGEKAGLVDATSGKTLGVVAGKFPANFQHGAFSSDLKLFACTRDFELLLLGVPAPK